MIESEIEQVVSFHTASDDENAWDIEEIYEVVDTMFPVTMESRVKMEDIHKEAGTKLEDAKSRTHLIKYLIGIAHKEYKNLEARVEDENMMRNLERGVVLRIIDRLWIDHLSQMDHLRTGIGLRGYGQRDPLIEYKKEAYLLFTTMMASLQTNTAHTIYKIGIAKEIAPSMMQAKQITQAPSKTMNNQHQHFSVPMEQPQAANDTFSQAKPQALPGTNVAESGKLKTIEGEKVGRNAPCPCGSGKKYKKCHG